MAKSNTKDITKGREKRGRPTKYDEEIVRNFEAAFQSGVSDIMACEWVGINKDTYYTWIKEKPGFSDRMIRAKNFLRVISGGVVKKDIVGGSVPTAKWWLEKKHPDEFHPGGNINVAVDARQVHVTLPERDG